MPGGSRTPPVRGKLDRFWAGLFLTPEGRPKSAKLLYTFCLSLVFLLIYGACYWFLIDPLERAFHGSPVLVRNLFESILPGLAGSVLCCAFYFVFKDKSYLPFIYSWLTVYAVTALVSLLLMTDKENMGLLLQLYVLIVPAGLVSGSVFSWWMYALWRSGTRTI